MFIVFAFSFAKPQTRRDWRSFGAFSGFLMALFAEMRHPQYAAFVLVMFGFLLQWPTVLTLLMVPILVAMYVRLARTEEREAAGAFGDLWESLARRTPRFVPKLDWPGPARHHA